MARRTTARVDIEGRDRVTPVARRAQFSLQRLSSFLVSGFGIGLATVTAGITSLVSKTREWIDASGTQEANLQRLRGALASLGPETERVTQALAAQAAALQQNSTFGDEQIFLVQQQIANFVREEEAIKRLTEVTLDFATATGLQAESAAALLGKTIGSTTNALSRYGIEVEGAINSQERINNLVENATRLFGGQSEAAVNSYRGAVKQLENAQGDLQEVLGDVLIGSDEVTESIDEQKEAVERLAQIVKSAPGLFDLYARASSSLSTGLTNLTSNLLIGTLAITDLLGITSKAEDATIRAAAATDEFEESLEGLTDAAKRAARIEKELSEGADSFRAAVEALGVELNTTLRKELEANNEVLEEARRRLSLGGLEYSDYLEIVQKVEAANAELRVKLGETNDEVKVQEEAVRAAKPALDNLAASTRNTGQQYRVAQQNLSSFRTELRAASSDARFSAAAFDRLADATTRANAVQVALQNGARIVNGTRIQLPGGGSRLVRSSDRDFERSRFTGFTISGGTFTTVTNRV